MAAPTVLGTGTGATDAGGAWSYTGANTGSGKVHILQVLQDGATASAVTLTGLTGMNALDGTTSSMTFIGSFDAGNPTAAIQHLWIGRKTSAFAMVYSGGNSTSEDLYITEYVFQDVSAGTTLETVIENGTAGGTATNKNTGTNLSSTSVTTLGPDRLALQFLGINDDLDLLTGPSVYFKHFAYAEASGTDGGIQLWRTTASTAQTVAAGAATINASSAWGFVGFALIGTTVEEADRVVYRNPMPQLIAQ